MDKLYTVTTNDYMLAGGDGYTSLGGGKVMIDKGNGSLMANDVMNYIAKMGSVAPKVEGRIRKVGG
jgi:2',3'-cyclic-nucleotide 2'-phosphodiesterase (5'-nucleotidase family)